ncbi:hypothetical protein [Lutimonas sp.]|uniref:hypothetical protein n=1 Tax=Lutimonas sp. TaxID=1872403 RepID=UPI003D9BD70C
MTPFFRRIRKKLADDNQFIKYSRYAIGEIILVVLGILIALQVNDMNESKKQKNQLISKLKKVESELILNIQYLDRQINFALETDSLLRTIINEQVELKTYKESPLYPNLITTYQNVDVLDNTYKSFVSNQENIPESLDSLKMYLDAFYQFDVVGMMSSSGLVAEVCADYIIFLRDDKVWYKDIKLGSMTDEMYDFHLHDQRFMNYAYFYYRMFGPNFLRSLQEGRTTAVKAYNRLFQYLSHEDPSRNEEKLFDIDPSNFPFYHGNYNSNAPFVSIQSRGNALFLHRKDFDGLVQEYSIVPIDQNTFYINNSYGIYHIKTDNNNEKSLIHGGENPAYEVYVQSD